MAIGNGRGNLEPLIREPLANRWWSMSPTSQLAHHPFGAAVARLAHPAGASGGGEEGWSIPLVSQSERTRRRIAMHWTHCARDAQMLVGIRQRQMHPPGTSVCAAEVGPMFVGIPVTVLCLATVVSAWHGEAPGGGGLARAALTAAVLAVVSLLAGAVWLSISDWMAEISSRVTWAAIGPVTDEFSSVPLVDAPDREDLYPPAVANERVRAVLDAHRHWVPASAVEDVTDLRAASLPSVASIAQVPSVRSGADSIATDNGCRPTGTLAFGAALRVVSGVRPEVRKACRKVASAVAASGSKARGARIAIRSRCIVNGSRWDAWSEPNPRHWVMGLPINVVSNIFVRAQGDNGPVDEKRPPRPTLDSPRIRAGPGATVSIRGSTGPVGSRACRDKELDATAYAGARRRVIALAEALARQAAREDDAADDAAGRSVGPDAGTLSFGRNGADGDASG